MESKKWIALYVVGIALVLGYRPAKTLVGMVTLESPQMVGESADTNSGWVVRPLVTIGEQNAQGEDFNQKWFHYRPLGKLDGLTAFRLTPSVVRILANHEIAAERGYAYRLANQAELTGARLSYFDIDVTQRRVLRGGLAFSKIYDRAGLEVTRASQINEGNTVGLEDGFDRFCSANSFLAQDHGLVDSIVFAGEEVSDGLGGQACALDVANSEIYVVPMLGRAAWESLTLADNLGSNKVLAVVGDDRAPAPLILYIGEKDASPPGSTYSPPGFLVRNGLGQGHLYVWVADGPAKNPLGFRGTGNNATGRFVKIVHFDPSKAGLAGYDSLGFASQATLNAKAFAVGAFSFARPEDVATNPSDGTQIVMAATGRSNLFGGLDSWGTTYVIDIGVEQVDLNGSLASIDDIPAAISILYDGDDAGAGQFSSPDAGLRNPDNLDWADDGYIYIQEDASFSGFGLTTGIEASVWRADTTTGELTRILEMNRSAVPLGQMQTGINVIGQWESSGVLDVSELFPRKPGESTVLILTVQAHGLFGGGLAKSAPQNQDLVEGGQLLLATK